MTVPNSTEVGALVASMVAYAFHLHKQSHSLVSVYDYAIIHMHRQQCYSCSTLHVRIELQKHAMKINQSL